MASSTKRKDRDVVGVSKKPVRSGGISPSGKPEGSRQGTQSSDVEGSSNAMLSGTPNKG